MGAKIWLISDTHFGHDNIIRYSERPFRSADEMDEAIIAHWNAAVRSQDHIYHLGDVTMARGSMRSQPAQRFIAMCQRLHGHKRLILGNHDHFDVRTYIEAGFAKVMASNVFEGWLLTHIPVHPQSMGRFKGNIHGHIHERPSFAAVDVIDPRTHEAYTAPYVNVSVERTGYRPIELEQIMLGGWR